MGRMANQQATEATMTLMHEKSIVHENSNSELSDSEGKYKSDLEQQLEEQSGVKKDKHNPLLVETEQIAD